jgi:TM2 domain-containing membrane protein YozV
MFCPKCGAEVKDTDTFCPKCGANLKGDTSNNATYTPAANSIDNPANGRPVSFRSRGIATILCCLGFFVVGGIHRFYVGKIGTGILWLLTGGLFGIGTIVDLIEIITGDFTDIDGKYLINWKLDD